MDVNAQLLELHVGSYSSSPPGNMKQNVTETSDVHFW